MSEDARPVGEDDVEAHVDGRLSGPALARLEAMMASDPALRGRVQTDQALRQALRDRLASVVSEPLPGRLRVSAILARRRARLRSRFRAAAVAVLLLGTGGVAGWGARDWSGAADAGRLAAADAIGAHRVFTAETVHPVEVTARQQGHLVQWLSRRVGHALRIPDLSLEGYELLGGRVVPEDGRAAAQIMYQDRAGGRLTLLVRAARGGDARPRFVQAGGLSALSWTEDGLGFAMVAPAGRAALLAAAGAVRAQDDGAGQGAPPRQP